MKIVVAILILAGMGVVAWKLFEKWEETSRKEELGLNQSKAPLDERSIPGLDNRLENSLAEARKGGASGLKNWIEQYGRSPLLKDPRLASIELDYAVLLQTKDPAEARKIFARVKERTPSDSPVYARIQGLQKSLGG